MGHRIPNYGEERKAMESDKPQEPRQDVVPPHYDDATSQQENSEPGPALPPARGVEHQQGTDQKTGSARYGWTWKGVVESLTLVGILGTLVATCEQNEVMRETFRMDKRAWVGVIGTKPLGEMIPGEPFRVRIRFKNVGNSPGLYVETQAYFSPVIGVREVMKKVPFMDYSMLPLCIRPKPQWDERVNGIFVMPGKEHVWIDQPTTYPMNETTIKLVKGKEYDDPVVSPEEFEQFPIRMRIEPNDLGDSSKRKKVGLYLVGCINYFDEFKVSHRTTFCLRYEHALEEKDRVFSMCEYGNDAD